MAHQFWISYHPPAGAKHASSGDETPPIPEEDLEQQKIEREYQVQKEKERQAREAEEDKQLDIELLHQRAIEAGEEQKRDSCDGVKALPGMNTSWSHHRLCDLQRQGAKWRLSRTSVAESTKNYRNALKKACSTQLTKPESKISIGESDGIFINLTRRCSDNHPPQKFREDEDQSGCLSDSVMEAGTRRASDNDVRHHLSSSLVRAPSCPGCRAPIASLDCMDDFSATSQQLLYQADEGSLTRHISTYLGLHHNIPTATMPGLRHKSLGKSGLRVPNVGLGLWSLYSSVSDEISEEIVNIAIDNGITLFDLSEAHCAKAEIELGKILKIRNLKRAAFTVTTKVYWSTKSDERGLSRKHIVESVKASLSRLQLDYIDVVMLHKVDPICPMEEMVRAMNFVINQGWVMYWGTARWSPSEIMEAFNACRQFNCVLPIVEQTEYHMFCREKAELYMPELYHKIGVGLMAWSAVTTGKVPEEMSFPFNKSRFNRKFSTFSWCEDEVAEADIKPAECKEHDVKDDIKSHTEKLRELTTLANSLNCSLNQMSLAWCLKNDHVACLLLGANSVNQFKENVHALQIVPQLSHVVMAEIERLLDNKPQRPPMVSTLAMRQQQNNSNVVVDIPESETDSPKREGSPRLKLGRGFCQIQ